jgi:predicted metal-dependent enzyme (double-stranded beta helix superfamily)
MDTAVRDSIGVRRRHSPPQQENAMERSDYSIDELVRDLKQVAAGSADERTLLARARPLARRAALAKHAWLSERMYEADAEQGFGVYLLHEEDDHTFAVLAISWLPNRGTPPHNHGTWGLVAAVDGDETNEFFRRVDDGSRPGYAELTKIGTKVFGVGDVLAMPSDTIHAVWNHSGRTTVSLHMYGRNINFTGRSQFDPERRTELPFVLRMETA